MLLKKIQSIISVNPEEYEKEVVPCLHTHEIQKGTYLVKEGQVCNSLYFIEKGYLRVYIQDEGEERTVHIGCPGEFISSFYSYISRQASFEYLQVISEASLISISYESVNMLYDINPKWERIGRKILEQQFVRKEDRVISFIRHSAEKRYSYLLKNDPHMLQHVPLQYIASYLGIKQETLSRIRAKKY